MLKYSTRLGWVLDVRSIAHTPLNPRHTLLGRVGELDSLVRLCYLTP